MANSVNKPAFVAEVADNVQASDYIANNVATHALAGDSVIDPTAGSYEALLAGSAAAVGGFVCEDVDGNEVIFITARRNS